MALLPRQFSCRFIIKQGEQRSTKKELSLQKEINAQKMDSVSLWQFIESFHRLKVYFTYLSLSFR